MIASTAQVLDMLEDIKKYLYVQSKKQDAGHTSLNLFRSPPGIEFSKEGGLRFQDKMLYWKDVMWQVSPLHHNRYSTCKLTPCTRSDLRPGDIAYMSLHKEHDFCCLGDYYIIISGDEAVHWEGSGNVTISIVNFDYNYRVEIK